MGNFVIVGYEDYINIPFNFFFNFLNHIHEIVLASAIPHLHLCVSDSTGAVAHSPGTTRRGGADHTGQ